jgi:predicted nuclease of predicted toxin-antitoxin system
MRPLDFPLLADENIHPEVIRSLIQEGTNITSVIGEGMAGQPDIDILRHAHAQHRAVLTHDGDFGALAIGRGEPFTGVIYLRPGHISAVFVLETLKAIASTTTEVEPPFLVVAERKAEMVKVRIRPGGARP